MRVDAAATLLRKCRSPTEARILHSQIARAGLDRNTFVANLVIHMYSVCGGLRDAENVFHSGAARRNVYSWTILLRAFAQTEDLARARDVFTRMAHRDVVSWNALIAGEALGFFRGLDLQGVAPDSISFVSVLDAIAGIEELDRDLARAIAMEAIRLGIHTQIAVGTALVVVYGKIGEAESAEHFFDRIIGRNAICWNAMLSAYAQSGNLCKAREFFDRMPCVDVISWTTIIDATSRHERLQDAKDLFDCIKQRDLAVWNALLSAFAQKGHFFESIDLYERLPAHDLRSRTSLLIAYASKGDMVSLQEIFHQTSHKDATLWNAMITALALLGHMLEALDLFDSMDVLKNKLTYIIAIDACGSLGDPDRCERIFHLSQACGSLRSDHGVSCSLIKMFGRSGAVERAELVFEQKKRRRELWNAMIATYAHNGCLDEAMLLFKTMPRRDLSSWSIVARAQAQQGHFDQALFLLEISPEITIAACNALITAYLQRGHLASARRVFDRMEQRDTSSWSSIIAAYAQLGHCEESLALFWQIDTTPDRATFLAALDACSGLSSLSHCRQVHAAADHTGWISDLAVATSLVASYGKCKGVEESKAVFDRIEHPSTVSWNSLLRSYAQNGHLAKAASFLEETIPSPDVVSFNTLAAAYIQHGRVNEALEILTKRMPCWDSFSHNTAMAAHAQAGHIHKAKEIFEKMEEPSTVSWNTLICIFVQAGECESAARLFHQMDLEGAQADKVSFLAVLDALGRITALQKGKLVHGELHHSRFQSDVITSNAVVNFYGRCGYLQGAKVAFEAMTRQDVVSWNGIISVYANNGHFEETFDLFWRMKLEGLDPDEVTFVSVLSACSHAGLFESGKYSFQSLVLDHHIAPNLEHFMCVIDLLGRTGRLDEAQEVIDSMPIEPGSIAYMTLLGACKTHGNNRLGNMAAPSAITRASGASTYVLLSHICVE
ncbi:pentatricopeptide repeat-containing protein At4g02750-like [Selaginella moellendorffii]|uniref:pentatricopeptide repeat-containing protein At4g02750-like n=1 Tax=Selaginella moellendorffii TaxID=88036 RepID=UPI000D1C262B|nr:pentatricopeptide repeat-containing protein At4g02750-like [Selaginella moellendorffii]|eukprot:XP_024545182.1 pentatricopeptide repeat-containing protein At4g02750-like [Selaginella moellendorffii]